MKNIFKLLIIVILIIQFNSCSSDDDGIEDNEPQTFLEKYDGLVIGGAVEFNQYWYVRFINNLNSPWEFFAPAVSSSNGVICFSYRLMSLSDSEENGEITINRVGEFEIKRNINSNLYEYPLVNFSAFRALDDGVFELENRTYDDSGNLISYDLTTYNFVTVDVDDLTLCD